jgi:hypothetical protein
MSIFNFIFISFYCLRFAPHLPRYGVSLQHPLKYFTLYIFFYLQQRPLNYILYTYKC